MERFVLHDPPYSPDDESSQDAARAFALEIRDLLDQDKRAEAIEMTLRGTGMPDDMINEIRESPRWAGIDGTRQQYFDLLWRGPNEVVS